MFSGHLRVARHVLPALLISHMPQSAAAHVKWFEPYDLFATPAALHQVLSPSFFGILALGLLVLTAVTVLEASAVGQRIGGRVISAITVDHLKLDDVMRIGTAMFFVSLWATGGVLLTPELHTDLVWVSWLQLAIAVGLFFRVTRTLSAVGIVALWVIAVAQFGIFHLLDYPIFLAVALYFGLCAWPASRFHRYRFDVLRWGVAITMMWASIEKFAYPEWSFPILEQLSFLTFGMHQLMFMKLAGLVEFALGFGLICTPVVRKLAALALGGMIAAAIIPFGRVDAIGHLMILLILAITVFGSPSGAVILPRWALVPLKPICLALFLGGYYGLQALIYSDASINQLAAFHTGLRAPVLSTSAIAPPKALTVQLPPDQPEPQIDVHLTKADGKTWDLHIDARHFTFSAVCTTDAESGSIGHAHIYIEGKKVAAAYAPVVSLGDLPAGQHVLRIVLQAQDHRTIVGVNGPITKEIRIDTRDLMAIHSG
ncbi:DUF305 domain-containing protein [Litoreibacter roseus]|uniref:Uncharacterized protein n=1 Tax=Litoreibacter roseus TaxID=2601869 RepID=A0A6N6JN03_9RHOB|nr:DUF305 domain-containing protein [Litoreibacter roseus]GFE66728.1 hypothetical protein KIN_38020 [Litoreibacter roseus]